MPAASLRTPAGSRRRERAAPRRWCRWRRRRRRRPARSSTRRRRPSAGPNTKASAPAPSMSALMPSIVSVSFGQERCERAGSGHDRRRRQAEQRAHAMSPVQRSDEGDRDDDGHVDELRADEHTLRPEAVDQRARDQRADHRRDGEHRHEQRDLARSRSEGVGGHSPHADEERRLAAHAGDEARQGHACYGGVAQEHGGAAFGSIRGYGGTISLQGEASGAVAADDLVLERADVLDPDLDAVARRRAGRYRPACRSARRRRAPASSRC